MANLSDAFGTFTINNYKALTKEDIQKLLVMIDEMLDTNAQYNTSLKVNIDNLEEKGSCFNQEILEDFMKSRCTTSFDGTGRWVYSNNIENMFEWILYGIEEKNDDNFRRLINKLIQKEVSFTFDYNDYEPGCNPETVFSEIYVVRPAIDPKTNKVKTEIIELVNESLKATGDTMMELNYIEGYKTLEEMKLEKDDHFLNDEQFNEWIEDNEEFFEDGAYVYDPDSGYFLPAS